MQPPQLTPPNRFGEPLDLEDLLDFAEIDEADIDSAVDWFDENASEEWIGVLEAPPYKGE